MHCVRGRDNLTIPFQQALGRLDIAALDVHLHAKLAHFLVKVIKFVCVLLRTLPPEAFELFLKALHLSFDHCPHF